MNKAQLIDAMTTGPMGNKAETERFLNRFINMVTETVRKGDDVKIVGFGTFVKTKRKARKGRNPQTGETINIPAAWYPKFRAGSEFKEMVK